MPTAYVSVASDIVHEGILNVIARAAELGEVVVGLMSDEAIATYKRVPLLDWESRRSVYAALRAMEGDVFYAITDAVDAALERTRELAGK